MEKWKKAFRKRRISLTVWEVFDYFGLPSFLFLIVIFFVSKPIAKHYDLNEVLLQVVFALLMVAYLSRKYYDLYFLEYSFPHSAEAFKKASKAMRIEQRWCVTSLTKCYFEAKDVRFWHRGPIRWTFVSDGNRILVNAVPDPGQPGYPYWFGRKKKIRIFLARLAEAQAGMPVVERSAKVAEKRLCKEESPWTVKKTLFRALMYPLCISFFGAFIFAVAYGDLDLPSALGLSLGFVVLPAVYIVLDLAVLFDRRKR
ncbi:hypothetical protein FUAX_01950 [Fulvitalea axinellae]|uniref:PH domain-containing protein n=1 Tax=Fulvitalea axinellae TaxID=1182444 RepID=A0AAU9CW12_9BACT|nr:hypothetical protein FUAX_01950 [Fulvitalea axinellae]